jgi:hypothetical protein
MASMMAWLLNQAMANQTRAMTTASGMVPASIDPARVMSSPSVPPELGRTPNPIRISCRP